MNKPHGCLAAIALATFLGSCGGGDSAVAPPSPTVASVTVSRDTATLVPAASLQLSATAKTSSGETLQRTFAWSTSDAAKATVSNSGTVAGVAPGVATITAAADGKSATATITVLEGGIISTSGGTVTAQSGAVEIIIPADALATSTNISVAVSNAFASDPRVIRAFDFGPPGTNFAKPIALKIKYDPATLPPGTEEAALELYLRTTSGWQVVTPSTVDLTAKTVSASVSHFSTYATLTPEPVAAIAIGGGAPLTVGQSEQLTASLTAADGRVLTNRVVTWSTSDATIATVSQTGIVAALKAGTVTITASAGGKASSTSFTIVDAAPPPVASVTLSTATTPMQVGASQVLTAAPKDASGNHLSARTVTWVSSNTAVLTVSAASTVSTSTGASVSVTAAGVGTATITATSETAPGATTPTITVNPVPVATVTVSPPSASIVVGGTQQLAAVLRDAAGNVLTGRSVTWSSGNTGIATVNGNGLVTGVVAGGPINITATSEGHTGTSSITITAPLTLRADPFISSGLSAPVFLTQPLNDGRIFVVEQGGRIRVVRNGVLQATPFLDITSRVLSGGERGLLSVAFHPNYATNHYFYVFFTTQTNGDIRIERFTTTVDPEVADPATSKLIITAPHSTYANHNGGLLAFGPDGMLYAGLGDGGSGGDPLGNGQNFNSLLGALLRLDIDHGDPYQIPADNPFFGLPNRRGELWAKGLRNPWRYAFDATTGLLFIADVGQALHEEVDAVAATQGGVNYGWNIMEGFSCYLATTCNQTGLQLPILDYGHTGGACSITGGYVYRGSAMPAIQGHYFYSDYCAGWLRSLRYQAGAAVDQKDWGLALGNVASFGQDIAGELYVISGSTISKLVPGN